MSMLFALVLLGCADDGTQCERLAAQPEQYASKAMCEAGQEDALQSDAALRADYPLVITRCVRCAPNRRTSGTENLSPSEDGGDADRSSRPLSATRQDARHAPKRANGERAWAGLTD